MSMTLVAAAVTPIANGGTGATTAADARKNISGVADVPVTEMYNGGKDGYVRWGCRNGVVTIAWDVIQTTTNQWKAGSVGRAYAPLVVNNSLTVACWAPNGKTATAWIDASGGLYLQCSTAQSDGRNVGSMSYIAHG